MPSGRRHAAVPPLAVAAGPTPADRAMLKPGKDSEQESMLSEYPRSRLTSANTNRTVSQSSYGFKKESTPVINISSTKKNTHAPSATDATEELADELDYITVPPQSGDPSSPPSPISYRTDKASRILGIKHRKSMEPIPASARNSIVSTRSVRDIPSIPSLTPTLPLTSLYVVSGLPKSPHTWTLADPDSVLGLHHAEGAVNRWWRPEVLGSTVSPGAGGTAGTKKKKRGKGDDLVKGNGSLSKQEVGKMLSKALKLSFTREVEIIASTLQPASTIHTFTFTLPAPNTPLAPTPSSDLLRASALTNADHRNSVATFNYTYTDDPFPRPSTAFLGPPSIFRGNSHGNPAAPGASSSGPEQVTGNTVTYHGVCLTVWSHADAERSNAIRRTLEAGRLRKESAQSLVTSRLKNLRADVSSSAGDSAADPTVQARRHAKKDARGPWGDAETDGETEPDGGAVSESDFEVASTVGHGPGESTLFLPGDTVFWLPYALTLVSRHPVYDLMRDYLTLSWARFSKDVQSHTLQISKILSHPAPRAGELIKLDASSKSDSTDASLEVIARFPGGLDFGRGLVDINFTMWPLFKCLNIDHILTICEIALSPTGRILFFSRHPAMLGIAVFTIKYLVELRGWNGICLPAVHSRDAKIYIDDPGPWIMGLATEARYSVRPAPEVCVCDLDINYLSCPSPPVGALSVKQQREKYKQRLLAAFDSHYHPDHSVPSEFKEAFPAGRFRPVCKIQAKRGASSSAVAEQIKPPEWWHSTRIIQAFDSVLQDKFKKPSLLKRIGMFGSTKRQPQLSAAEQHVQLSIRKRATAFVDARDDLETKIGRLSRRLNFLMTESDLWRDKFVTFESYAEKLSAEATQLRAKINKEQKETRRLSGLVTLTAAEKNKLQTELRDTEKAHKDAVLELEKMRETMDKMEQEREEMIAEVEAQIEKALASMAVGMDESDYTDSRPSSRMSSTSKPTRSRRPSDAAPSMRPIRSVATESTLAETDGEVENGDADGDAQEVTVPSDQKKGAQSEPATPSKKKRFSASEVDLPQDTMNAVDEGISIKSDKIARKVLEIEQKLESALSSEHRRRKRRPKANGVMSPDTEEESSNTHRSSHSRKSKRGRSYTKSPPEKRPRSGTASSTQTAHSNRTEGTVMHPRSFLSVSPESTERSIVDTPPRSTIEPVQDIDETLPEGDSTSLRLTPHGTLPTEDSDNDFQSAHSRSPQSSPQRNFADDGQVIDAES